MGDVGSQYPFSSEVICQLSLLIYRTLRRFGFWIYCSVGSWFLLRLSHPCAKLKPARLPVGLYWPKSLFGARSLVSRSLYHYTCHKSPFNIHFGCYILCYHTIPQKPTKQNMPSGSPLEHQARKAQKCIIRFGKHVCLSRNTEERHGSTGRLENEPLFLLANVNIAPFEVKGTSA